MLLELNRKIKKILEKRVVIYQLFPGVGLGAVRACPAQTRVCSDE